MRGMGRRKHLPTKAEEVEADARALAGELEVPLTLSEKQETVLEVIKLYGMDDGHAAFLAGTTRWSVWRWKKYDQQFAEQYREARKVGIEQLEAEAKRRAMNGSDR